MIVVLRPFERRHLDASLKWFNDPSLARLLDRVRPITPEQHDAWFRGLDSRSDLRYFAVEREDDGTHVGNVWLANIDTRHAKAEVRIVVGEGSATGVGLGTEAIQLIADAAFDELGLSKLSAQVLEHNTRALRAFRKAGFVTEGRLAADRRINGRYEDVLILGRCRPDRVVVEPHAEHACQA